MPKYQNFQEEILYKIKQLEHRLCCKTQFYTTIEDFPAEGEDKVIYVDESTGAFYIWNGTGYVSADSGSEAELTGEGEPTRIAFWVGTSPSYQLFSDTNLYWDNATKRIITSDIQLSTTTAATVDTDKFVVFDSGLLKYRTGSEVLSDIGAQAALTNPVTGTGASGQVAYWSGTGTQSGSNNLFWDAANNKLGIGTNTLTSATRLVVQGTAASDAGQLGSELLTTGTGDASWTGSDFATGYTHVAGSTTTLTSTLAGVVNNYYQITYTVTGRTAGTFTVAFGGYISGALSATGAVGPRATTTGTLVITPTSDFNGTIVLSIKVISASTATVSFLSSEGTVTNEIRANSINTNTFIGRLSGQRNTTGIQNTSLGNITLSQNTTGNSNIAIGNSALFLNTIGSSNTAIGLSALSGNTTGSRNTVIGENAIVANATGSFNVALGSFNLIGLTSGSNNTALGTFAGRFISGGSVAITTSNNSIFLGFDTRANADNETNQIVIGYLTTGLGSNTTNIGNASTTQTNLYGNLTLGTTTSGGRLTVRGSGTTSATTALLVQNGTPSTLLEVKDNGEVSINSSGTYNITSRIRISPDTSTGADGSVLFQNTSGTSFTAMKFGQATASFPAIFRASNNIEIRNGDGTYGAGISVGASLNSTAILQADSTTKGFLPPRLTTAQRDLIATPAAGLVIFNTTTTKLECYDGAVWQAAW
jgi:hypothetical protein